MKPLPPTLRENYRYILYEIDPPDTSLEKKYIYQTIAERGRSLIGDNGFSLVNPSLIIKQDKYCIIRCRRGEEKMLLAITATVTSGFGQGIALRPLATSGTMKSLKDRFMKRNGRNQ